LGKRKIYKAKNRKLKCINTHQSYPKSQDPPVDLAQASRISLERDNASNVGLFTFYSPSEPISAQARSHLSPRKIG